jgi:hypothetical protein
MREAIIEAGIKALKEYGYPAVNKDNIMTDTIYSQFFKSMLRGTIDDAHGNKELIFMCNTLISEIKTK